MADFEFAPKYNYFSTVVTDYENEVGEIEGIYRDPRGIIYHPHLRQDIPLGTLNVEDYRRPDWLFDKVLYIEKEGLFSILKEEEWPERHDCALMTSKGQGTRAAKDLIDHLAKTGQPCKFFIIHDADAAGTMIYQCLQEETRARGARTVKIINLGLEPEEGREMGLAVEEVSYEKRQAVADYVPHADREWLQANRIELDAMSSPEFVEWLDAKFEPYAKLVPPVSVMRRRLASDVKELLREEITAEILEEAGINRLVEEAFEKRMVEIEARVESLAGDVAKALADDESRPWTGPIGDVAREIVDESAS
jgi:hypothetical protein